MGLPIGCIGSGVLRDLADALDRLNEWHVTHKGAGMDRPCLRRIEANGDVVSAHISAGPPVGGSWIVLELTVFGWKIRDE